jgi:hypothetical protein
MARQETPREDLLAEATALVERVEIAVPGFPEPIVAGFRKDGCASVYFGESPAYHFNTRGQLRRAFIDPLLYKAEGGKLVSLQRQRGPGETALVRHELTEDEAAALLEDCARRLIRLTERLAAGEFRILRQVPAEGGQLRHLRAYLTQLPLPPVVARAPHAR